MRLRDLVPGNRVTARTEMFLGPVTIQVVGVGRNGEGEGPWVLVTTRTGSEKVLMPSALHPLVEEETR